MAWRDPFEVLGVTRTASSAEVRRAFRKKALAHHPDRNGGSPEAAAKFREAKEAYEAIREGKTHPPRPRPRPNPDAEGVGTDFSKYSYEELLEELRRRGGWDYSEVGDPDAGASGGYTSGVPDLKDAHLCTKCRGIGELARSRGYIMFMVACPACGNQKVKTSPPNR
jgi:DnaJ domain